MDAIPSLRDAPVAMQIEIINTGSELMFGNVLNTHQQWLCRQLTDAGWIVSRQTAVSDDGLDIVTAVREALVRSELVIVTGGLGPTSDDITRDEVARLLGRPLAEDVSVRQHILDFFSRRGRVAPASTLVQAQVPEGAIVMHNQYGTAPGLAWVLDPNPFRDSNRAVLLMLPGPPRELRPMFTEQSLPWLQSVFPKPVPLVVRTLRTIGIGETYVEMEIAGPLAKLCERGLQLGYCARTGEVDVRLSARGASAQDLVVQAADIVQTLLGNSIYGEGEQRLEEVVLRECASQGRTLALAESCTGGHIANRLTDIPGASAVLVAGWVAYSNESKVRQLRVSQQTLDSHGAVSEAVAREMAEHARQESNADYALAVTGFAGPDGGTASDPVGTVFIALATSRGTEVSRRANYYERGTFKYVTTQQALELLRREVLGIGNSAEKK
ncbi:MAG: competence/damage-inducible protein A [Pedosphaera sp.]|nr:competence/damage-inducible protein A [Pedosphaera sp.]